MHRNNDKAEGLQPTGELIVTVESVKPLRNTRNGNTIKRVATKDGAYYVTVADSHAGQIIENFVGKRAAITLNYAGRLATVRQA